MLELKKKRRSTASPSEGMAARHKQLGIQLSQVSGSTGFVSRDPVYHLANTYVEKFNAVGKNRAAQMNDEAPEKSSDGNKPEAQQSDSHSLHRKHDSPMYRHSEKELSEGSFADRFSSYAFNGGNMAAAVMAGKGRMMFTACLSNALGRPVPAGEKQKTVLSQSAVRNNADGIPAEVMFNRNVNSAVGIVLDTIRGSSSTLDIFRRLVNDSGAIADTPLEKRSIETLSRLYPFMITDQDSKLIEKYKDSIKQLEGDNSPQALNTRRSLEWALKKEASVLQRKKVEQQRFMTLLNRIRSNVNEAEKLFSSDGFAESIIEELDSTVPDLPPDDSGKKDSGIPTAAELISEVLKDDAGQDFTVGEKAPEIHSGESDEEKHTAAEPDGSYSGIGSRWE